MPPVVVASRHAWFPRRDNRPSSRGHRRPGVRAAPRADRQGPARAHRSGDPSCHVPACPRRGRRPGEADLFARLQFEAATTWCPPATVHRVRGCADGGDLEGARHRACRSGRRRSRWRRRCRHLPGRKLAALGCSTPPAVDLEPYRRHQLGPGSLCACLRWQRYQTPSGALDRSYEEFAVHVGHHELAAFGGSTAPTGHHHRGDASVTLTLRYDYA